MAKRLEFKDFHAFSGNYMETVNFWITENPEYAVINIESSPCSIRIWYYVGK